METIVKDYTKKGMFNRFTSDSTWTENTTISDVIPMLDSVIFTINRPTSGTNTGGVAYIRDKEDRHLIESIKIPGNNSPVTATLQSDKLDFEDESYILEYGPDQIDQELSKAVAATVDIIQASPENFQPSTCTPYNYSPTHILSKYRIPIQILSEGNKVEIYAVEGDRFLDDHNAIEKKIHELQSSDPNRGVALLEYKDGTFKKKQKYTVCLNVYSWKRHCWIHFYLLNTFNFIILDN